ncbi:hypothetical protein C2S51_018527 [Perilla frutescens var. frutescens]|nr:hypothetical protein C2S51_018527 [Perilla frutescens var. frutescens]
MDFVGPILDIMIRLWDCISKDVRTIRDVDENLKSLENALDQLKNVSEDVKRRVELEEERQMVRTKEVDGWLQKVDTVAKGVNDVLQRAERRPRRGCRFGCQRSCWSSYKLGKEVKKARRAVNELMNRGNFEFVAVMLPRGVVDERPLEDTVGLNSEFQEVENWIKDGQVRSIGLYGMGGVGKTTLLKKINNEFVKTSYGFDLVIWVVVSKQENVEKIQDSICEKLRLPENTWRNKSADEKAVEIFRILQLKKYVLLLDNIWKRVDLVKVGIPTSHDQMCKVIFTTRYEDVCFYMEADKKIKIKCLAREEALSLFRKKVGISTLNAHSSIPNLAEQVAEECNGLPLALITVGRAMAGKNDPRDWDRAITKLRKDPSRIMGVDDDVFLILKFSYDSLHDDDIKSCFVYCCIYPEDHEIPIADLLELWIGEGFLDAYSDVHDARDQGWEIIRRLKAASLLENGRSEEYVKMHDVVRDMALWISNGSKAKTSRYLVLDHVGMLEEHLLTSRVEAERVSLWGSSIISFTEIPSCPNVLTFLAKHTAMRIFAPGFLQYMSVMKVLDLSSNFQLAELPSGIGELVELKFLNLSNTRIKELPLELANLTKMKYLLLNSCHRMEVIPRQVISSFSLLRVFRISGSGYSTSNNDVEDNVLSGGRRYLLEELKRLQYISDIAVTLTDASSVQELQHSHKIQSCLTSVCFDRCKDLTLLELSSSSVERMRHLERLDIYYCNLHQVVINQELEHRHGFHNLRSIYIAYCDSLLDLTWLIHAPMLELLDVAHCASMVEIVTDHPSHVGGVEADLTMFSRLKKLRLLNVPSLRSIYPHPLSFPSLIEIHALACPHLKRLPFHSSTARGTLKEIRGDLWWWLWLQWDDEALEPIFRPYYVPDQPIW